MNVKFIFSIFKLVQKLINLYESNIYIARPKSSYTLFPIYYAPGPLITPIHHIISYMLFHISKMVFHDVFLPRRKYFSHVFIILIKLNATQTLYKNIFTKTLCWYGLGLREEEGAAALQFNHCSFFFHTEVVTFWEVSHLLLCIVNYIFSWCISY